MKRRIVGWVLLIIGGIGIIISAVIGSDWPMYTCMILSSAGAALLMCPGVAKVGPLADTTLMTSSLGKRMKLWCCLL